MPNRTADLGTWVRAPNPTRRFTGPSGSALWFDANLLHGSGSNIAPLPRSNIFLVVNSVENQLGEPFAAPRRRPEYLAARGANRVT